MGRLDSRLCLLSLDGVGVGVLRSWLSDRRPYSPSLRGRLVGESRIFSLSVDSFRDPDSLSLNLPYSPSLLLGGFCRLGRGKEEGGRLTHLLEDSGCLCCCEQRPCFSSSNISSGLLLLDPAPVTRPCRKPLGSNKGKLLLVTLASSGWDIFPFLDAEPGLGKPGKQQRPLWKHTKREGGGLGS